MQGGQIDIFSENNITEKAVFKQNPEELREQAIWRGAEQHSGWEDWVQSPEAERARGLCRCGWRTVSKRRDGREVVRRPDHAGRGNMDMGRQAPLEDFCKAQECYELLTYVLFILQSFWKDVTLSSCLLMGCPKKDTSFLWFAWQKCVTWIIRGNSPQAQIKEHSTKQLTCTPKMPVSWKTKKEWG